jgi:hypothetical protein
MIFFVGRQAMFGHDPPMYFRSTTAVRLPSRAIVQPISLPPVPLPSTSTSYFSGSLVVVIAASKFDTERVRSGVRVCDDLSIGAAATEAAVFILVMGTRPSVMNPGWLRRHESDFPLPIQRQWQLPLWR